MDNLYPLKTVRRKWTHLKDLPNPGMQGITFASVPTRDAHVQSCEMHRFKKSGYKHNLRHFIRPDLQPHSRLKYGYGHVDGDGIPIELKDNIKL